MKIEIKLISSGFSWLGRTRRVYASHCITVYYAVVQQNIIFSGIVLHVRIIVYTIRFNGIFAGIVLYVRRRYGRPYYIIHFNIDLKYVVAKFDSIIDRTILLFIHLLLFVQTVHSASHAQNISNGKKYRGILY